MVGHMESPPGIRLTGFYFGGYQKTLADGVAGYSPMASGWQVVFHFGEGRTEHIRPACKPAIGSTGYRVLFQQYQWNSASQCGTGHGHAGVTAQADHDSNRVLGKESSRLPIARPIARKKGNSISKSPRSGPAGNRQIVESGFLDQSLFLFATASDEDDP